MLPDIVHTSSLGAQFPFAETSPQHVAVASGVPAHDATAVAGGTENDVTVGMAPLFFSVLLCGVIAAKTSTAPGVVLKLKVCVVPGCSGVPTIVWLKLHDKMFCVSKSPPVAPVNPTKAVPPVPSPIFPRSVVTASTGVVV